MVDVFTKARLRQSSIETYEQSLYAKRPNFANFDDVDEALISRDDVSFGQSFAAAAQRTGVITGAVAFGAIKKEEFARGISDEIDPSYDLADVVAADPDLEKRLAPYLQDEFAHSRLIDNLVSSKNEDQMRFRLERYEAARDVERIAQANGMIAEGLGALAGVVPDIIATMGLGLLYHGGRGALAGGTALTRTQQALAGARFGLAEGTAEASMQYLADQTRTPADVALGASLGFAFGGALGATFAKIADVEPAMLPDHAWDDIARSAPRDPQAVGAAGVGTALDDAGGAVSKAKIGKGGNASNVLSSWMSKTPGFRWLAKNALRSPKAIIRDLGAKGAKEEAEGLEGAAHAYQGINKITRSTVAFADEVDGTGAARAVTAQDLRDQFEAASAGVTMATRRAHDEFLREVFQGQGIRGTVNRWREKVGGSTVGNWQHKGLDHPSFERWVDKLRKRDAEAAKANAKGKDADFVPPTSIVPQKILDQLEPHQKQRLFEKMDEAAKKVDEFYQEFAELEKRMGILDPDEVIDAGYTPQIWNRDAIEANRAKFERWLTRVWSQEADDQWVRSQFPEQILKREGAEDEVIPGIRPEETFEDFARREPALAREAQDTWEEEIFQGELAKLQKLEDEALAEYSRHNAKSIADIEARLAKATANDRKLVAKLEKQLATMKGFKHEKDAIADRIGKAEHRISAKEGRFHEARRLDSEVQDARKFISRHGAKKAGKESRRLEKKLVRASNKVDRKNAALYVSERVKAVTDRILDGESPYGLVPDGFKVNSSRFKRRAIHLGKHEFDEEADAFLQRDMAALREGYARGVGGQIAVRHQFGITGKEFNQRDVLDKILAGYERDMLKFKEGSKEWTKIRNARDETRELADYVLREILGEYELRNKAWDQAAGTMMTITAALSLGKVMLSQLSDLAVQAMAGGQLMTGLKALARPVKNSRALKEVAEDDEQMAVILMGLSTYNGRRMRNYADIDRTAVDIGGGKMSKVRRVADDIATVEGYANFMHVWNKFVREAFGIDFANQVHKHVTTKGWDGLTPSLKTFYARLGMGKNEFDRMANEFAKKGSKQYGGRVTVPDVKTWDQGLLNVYKRAVKAAGDEAMLDPSIADRPFLRATPGGRMLLQFQSFVFTAGDRFVAPLVQEIVTHPGEAMRAYSAVVIGLAAAWGNAYTRAYLRGEEEAWLDGWSDPSLGPRRMQEVLIRGPFAVGGLGMVEAATTRFAGGFANDQFESVAGFRPFTEATSRYQQQQGILGIMGPTVGNLSTIYSLGIQAQDDPAGAASRATNRIPIFNTLIPQLIKLYTIDRMME